MLPSIGFMIEKETIDPGVEEGEGQSRGVVVV